MIWRVGGWTKERFCAEMERLHSQNNFGEIGALISGCVNGTGVEIPSE
jgi:hypothetical protein